MSSENVIVVPLLLSVILPDTVLSSVTVGETVFEIPAVGSPEPVLVSE